MAAGAKVLFLRHIRFYFRVACFIYFSLLPEVDKEGGGVTVCPCARVCCSLVLKAHIPLEMGFHWIPNANEIYTKNMKCTWPTPVFCVGIQRNLYSTDWHWGLALGKTQISALGNAKICQHVGISNAKFWRRGHCPMPTPDARYFASQWNIGLTVIQTN